jgi:hypothetical protein
MAYTFTGIYEKIERAHENILNLQSAIALFVESKEYPMRSYEELQAMRQMVERFEDTPIPPKLSVLAGEIIHHFRSCFDHLAWQFSRDSYRRKFPNRIEFPVCLKCPIDDELSRYKRKIGGIDDIVVIDLIEGLQPYHSTDPLDDPLWIIHDMDRVDKHRELTVVAVGFHIRTPPHLSALADRYTRDEDIPIPPSVAAQFAKDLKMSPGIAFGKFGKREHQPMIPSLLYLENFVRQIIELFEMNWIMQ